MKFSIYIPILKKKSAPSGTGALACYTFSPEGRCLGRTFINSLAGVRDNRLFGIKNKKAWRYSYFLPSTPPEQILFADEVRDGDTFSYQIMTYDLFFSPNKDLKKIAEKEDFVQRYLNKGWTWDEDNLQEPVLHLVSEQKLKISLNPASLSLSKNGEGEKTIPQKAWMKTLNPLQAVFSGELDLRLPIRAEALSVGKRLSILHDFPNIFILKEAGISDYIIKFGLKEGLLRTKETTAEEILAIEPEFLKHAKDLFLYYPEVLVSCQNFSPLFPGMGAMVLADIEEFERRFLIHLNPTDRGLWLNSLVNLWHTMDKRYGKCPSDIDKVKLFSKFKDTAAEMYRAEMYRGNRDGIFERILKSAAEQIELEHMDREIAKDAEDIYY